MNLSHSPLGEYDTQFVLHNANYFSGHMNGRSRIRVDRSEVALFYTFR
jgi:hypothetical protein